MTDDQRLQAFYAIALIVVVIMAAVIVGRRKAKRDASEVQIARIVERNSLSSGTAIIGLLFGLTSVVCFGNYYFSRTTDQEIVRLLLCIANSAFWGVCLLANLITRGSASSVYRDRTPAERQEPRMDVTE